MASPAARNRMQKLAQQSLAQESTTPQQANGYELMLIQINAHKRILKGIQSTELKVARKVEMLPEYEAWVQGVLEGGQGVQDDVMTTVMVWRLDVGDIEGGLDIAEYAIKHNLKLPDQFNRTLGTFVAEEVAESQIKLLTQGHEGDLVVLYRTLDATNDTDMPDEVRAKLHKAIGLSLEKTNPQEALEQLNRAFALHDKCGVKKDVERIQRTLKKQNEPIAKQAESNHGGFLGEFTSKLTSKLKTNSASQSNSENQKDTQA